MSLTTIYNAVHELRNRNSLIVHNAARYQRVSARGFDEAIAAMQPPPRRIIADIMRFIANNFTGENRFTVYGVIHDKHNRLRFQYSDVIEAVELLVRSKLIVQVEPAHKPHDISLVTE